MLGLGACQRRRALDHVQPIHLLRVVGDAAAVGEVPRVANHRRADSEEIGVERDDDIGLVEVVDGLAGRARRLTQAQASAIAGDWIVLMPMRLRVVLKNRREELGQRGRGDRLGQNPETGAPSRLLAGQRRSDGCLKCGPRSDLTPVGDRLRPIRVVQAKYGGLRQDVGRPQTRRMLGISFDFRRTAHVALDEDRPRDAAERDGAGEKQGPAGNEVLRLADVGNDVLGRLPRAGANAGERERCAHQLEKVAPALGVVPLRRLLRELTVQVVAEVRGIGQLAQAPPVEAAVRTCETRSDCSEVHMVAISFQLSALSFRFITSNFSQLIVLGS